MNKWMPRARLGVHLGMLSRHARSVALVLNPSAGLVSPQHHCKFDATFGTVVGTNNKNHGAWKVKAKFTKNKDWGLTPIPNVTPQTAVEAAAPQPDFSSIPLKDYNVADVPNDELPDTVPDLQGIRNSEGARAEVPP